MFVFLRSDSSCFKPHHGVCQKAFFVCFACLKSFGNGVGRKALDGLMARPLVLCHMLLQDPGINLRERGLEPRLRKLLPRFHTGPQAFLTLHGRMFEILEVNTGNRGNRGRARGGLVGALFPLNCGIAVLLSHLIIDHGSVLKRTERRSNKRG